MNILIHSSDKKFKMDDIKNIRQRSEKSKMFKHQYRPYGIWYAEGTSWLDFYVRDMGGILGEKMNTDLTVEQAFLYNLHSGYKYFYFIKLNYTTLENPNKNKVVQIKTLDDLDNFTFKYGFMDDNGRFIRINWNKVSKDFGGTEIIPFRSYFPCLPDDKKELYKKNGFNIRDKACTIFWSDAWEVPSGCAWRRKAVKKFSLITKKLYLETGKEIQNPND